MECVYNLCVGWVDMRIRNVSFQQNSANISLYTPYDTCIHFAHICTELDTFCLAIKWITADHLHTKCLYYYWNHGSPAQPAGRAHANSIYMLTRIFTSHYVDYSQLHNAGGRKGTAQMPQHLAHLSLVAANATSAAYLSV